jgi:hypothetical protein
MLRARELSLILNFPFCAESSLCRGFVPEGSMRSGLSERGVRLGLYTLLKALFSRVSGEEARLTGGCEAGGVWGPVSWRQDLIGGRVSVPVVGKLPAVN